MGEQLLIDLINELVHKVRVIAEEIATKRFNGDDIYHTRLYVKIIVGRL